MCLCKPPQSTLNHPLTPEELKQSRLLWYRIVQRLWFDKEIHILSRGEALP